MIKNTAVIAAAQIRQLLFSKYKYLVWVSVFLIACMSGLTYGNEFTSVVREELSGSEYIAEGYISFVAGFVLIFISFSVGDICTGDIQDKTMYYELTTGKTRSEIYWGRVIPAVVFSLLGSMILILVSPVIVSMKHGWGTCFELSDILFRYTVMSAAIIRIICTMIFIAFILKKPMFTALVGVGEYLTTNYIHSDSDLLGVTSMHKILTSYERWDVYGLDEDWHMILDSNVTMSDLMFTVIISLTVAAFMLYLGHLYFRNDDLN
ncbi:MAG: hypothetical protein J5501_07310 [Ruminococcus sp.]|nr:hypothetical protein [Ruminococcus sp.]